MSVTRMTGLAPSTRLDTSYVSFDADRGVRSPRTPTYVPDSPSTTQARPFDHAKVFTEPAYETKNRQSIPPPPIEKPMAWIWICHICSTRYQLGVTRRCLNDGHYYCSGEPAKPAMRKRKKAKACSSEFDYAAWKHWGDWRRKVLKVMRNDRVFKRCEQCDFPSQCRYPVDTHPLGDVGTAVTIPEPEPAPEPATKKDDVEKRTSTADENVDFDQILKNILADADTTMLDADSLEHLEQEETISTKSKRKGKGSIATDDGLTREERILRDAVKVWADFEDVDLAKAKME